jgi:outer membrane protein OmpA-like peptidoglycan-associated protein
MLKKMFFCVLLLSGYAFSDEITIENNQLKFNQALSFATQTEELLSDNKVTIEQIKVFLEKKSYISTVRIEGHVNAFEDEQKNLLLSAERGLSVAKALVEAGVDCKHLLISAFGSSKPIAANSTPEGKAANNRVDLFVAALRGKAIGDMPLEGVGQRVGDACAK